MARNAQHRAHFEQCYRMQHEGASRFASVQTVPAPIALPLRETDIVQAVLELCEHHPKVAKVWRQNTGGAKYEYQGKARYVKFSFPGASDIMGVLKGGRFFAFEVKKPGEDATAEQASFLMTVARHGGLAIVVRSVDDAAHTLRLA